MKSVFTANHQPSPGDFVMTQAFKYFQLTASAIAASLVLSACGGGSADAPPTNTPTVVPDATAPTVVADTTPPTVAISDSVAGATAAGPVTFTFTFSEDVGTSFTAADVVVTGATAGLFTKVNATQYTLVATPSANTTGTINVDVAAGAFSDAASNANTAAATASQAYSTEATPVVNNLLSNGDFTNGNTGWSGNARNIVTEGGNSFNLANVAVAGNPFDVNLSNVVNIPTAGVRYKLSFKASSNRARTLVAGIGLNQDPFTADVKTVNLTTAQQTFEVFLTSSFANASSRVIFDMGADTGTVVIDDVVLELDTSTPTPTPVVTNLLSNGDFTNGNIGWSGNARNVVTEGGNSFNLANVAVAGNPFDVNLSNVVNIPTAGVRYKLSFKASSNRARTLVAGIGLNQDPFTADVKTVNLTTAQQTFDVSLTSNFANASSRVIFDMGADTGTVVIDDVVLVVDTSTPPAAVGGPTSAALSPTAAAANVTSIFSDSYTNLAVGAFGPDFGPFSSRITDGVIAGNNFKTMDVTAGKTFGAVSFVPSKFNATAFTTFHMDYWIDTPIPAGQVLSIKLSNHDGVVPGETSAIETTVTAITGGSWQRISIPLNNFTQAATSLSRNNIAEVIITAARADQGVPVKVHFDNMFFSR
jgi:Bacterial Ig-like domain